MSLEALQQRLGYSFRDKAILDRALTHSSLQKKDCDNERLEFLGDRVLGLVVAHRLYLRYPDDNEGSLAKRHTALVRQEALVTVAANIGLEDDIRLSSGEKKSGGSRKETILSDAVEALIGAVYLDGGLAAASAIVDRFWPENPDDLAPPEDPKSQLQEWLQARGKPLPVYRITGKSGSDHAPLFEIELSVEGEAPVQVTAPNRRSGEKEAAAILLKKLQKDAS